MYYPKSQIKTNLYSNGKDFALDGEAYKGFYYKTSDGLYFSGKSPSNPPNYPLQQVIVESDPVSNTTSLPNSNKANSYYIIDYAYWSAKGLNYNNPGSAPTSPISSITLPTEDDYKVGEFVRYFLKKINEIKYLEVSKDTYNLYKSKDYSVQYALYKTLKITWILTGTNKTVFNTNRNIVMLSETRNKCLGFVSYFNGNFTKYHRVNLIKENLETDGTEYKNEKTGRPYIGKYHIHPEKGAMVGATHIKEYHDYLIPIDRTPSSSMDYNVTRQETSRSSGGY